MNWTGSILILLAATLSLGRAQQTQPVDPHPAQDLRFLIVVDSSYSMLTRRDSTLGSVQGLVSSGFQDQIRPGEKFAVWTFNDEIDSGSFTAVWDHKRADFVAREASLFAGAYGHKARSNFDLLLSELGHLPALTTNVLVVLFTDGAERIYGTPFDGRINTAFEKEGLSLRTAARPFVVAFTIQEGRFTQPMIFSGRGPLRLPTLPRPAPATPPPAQTLAAQPKKPGPVALPPPEPGFKVERFKQTQPTPAPVVLNFPPGADVTQNDTPAPLALQPKPAAAAPKITAPKTTPAPAPTQLAQAQTTPAKPAPAPAPAKTISSNPPPAQQNSPDQQKTAPVAVATTTTGTPTPPTQKPPAATPSHLTAANPTPQSTPVQPPLTQPQKSDSFPSSTPLRSLTHSQLIWFAVGAASAALLVTAIFMLRATRKKTGPSLISRSLAGKH